MHGIARKPLTFARLFSKWCETHGRSPAQGSVALGYGPDIGNKWAGGRSLPPSTKVRSLAQAMGFKPERVARIVNAERASRKMAQ